MVSSSQLFVLSGKLWYNNGVASEQREQEKERISIMIKVTTASGKVIKMDVANAYNNGGFGAAMAVLNAAKMAMGNDEVVSMEVEED